jgi:hypothetical protein
MSLRSELAAKTCYGTYQLQANSKDLRRAALLGALALELAGMAAMMRADTRKLPEVIAPRAKIAANCSSANQLAGRAFQIGSGHGRAVHAGSSAQGVRRGSYRRSDLWPARTMVQRARATAVPARSNGIRPPVCRSLRASRHSHASRRQQGLLRRCPACRVTCVPKKNAPHGRSVWAFAGNAPFA